MTQCLFYRNWANYNAAIWLNYNSIDGITFFISSQFIESWSDFTSSIEYECESGISYIKNCSFLNNTASWSIRDSNYFVADNNNDYGCGGVFGINAKSGPTSMYIYSENNLFSMNYAKRKGAIMVTVGGNFTDNSSIFSYNKALLIGSFHIHIGTTITLNNSTIIDSFANEKSCISVREFCYFYIYGSIFKNILSSEGKGLIYVDGLCELIVVDSIFENITSVFGNILYVVFNLDSKIFFKNNTFQNNYNLKGKEMFYIASSTNVLFEGNFFNNTWNRMFFLTTASLILRNNVINLLSCISISQDGCAFYLSKSNITASGNYFTTINSKADGTLYFAQNSIIQINGEKTESISSSLNDSYTFSFHVSKIYLNYYSLEHFLPGGLHSVNASILSLSYCNFSQDMKSDLIQNPTLYSEDSLQLFIEFSSFINNFNSYNGSAIKLQCIMTGILMGSYYILQSFFDHNQAFSNGGAIYAQNCPLQINSSNFTKNLANLMGGAIFFEGNQNLVLNNDNFLDNSANEGGAVKYTDMPPIFDNTTNFQQNSALYGPNIAAYPVRFLAQTKFSLNGRPSPTESILKNFIISIIDVMNQTVSTLNNEYIDISMVDSQNNRTMKLVGDIKREIISGKINISSLFLYSNVSSDLCFIQITTSTISNQRSMNNLVLTSNEIIKNNEYIFQLDFNINNCSIGEIFDINLQACLLCSNGRYSLNPLSYSCEACPTEAQYCYGSVISLKSGYWRSDVNSTEIYACTPVSESCLGDYLSKCAVGYRGGLCQSCDVSDNIYSKSFGNVCV